MATNSIPRRRVYRIGLLAAIVALLTGGVLAYWAVAPAGAQTSVQLGTMEVGDVNTTVDGNVTEVTLDATVDYTWNVPDATEVLIKFKAGPTEDDLQTIAFRRFDSVGGTGSDSLTMAASVFDHPDFDAETFDPALAGSTTTDMVVGATIEVRRANGDPVTATVTVSVTVAVTGSPLARLTSMVAPTTMSVVVFSASAGSPLSPTLSYTLPLNR